MVFTPWSTKETELLVEMLQQGSSFKDISEAISVRVFAQEPGFCMRSARAVEKRAERVFKRSPLSTPDDESTTEDRWDKIKQCQARYAEDSVYDTTGILKAPVARKILALSDIHFPFARMDLIDQALADHKDADIVVLNGDILDGHIYSTFDKEKSVAAIDEYNCAFEFVYELHKKFPQIVMTEGNHDYRVVKSLRRAGFTPDAYDVFRPNLLSRIANGERLGPDGLVKERVHMKNVFFSPTESWWIQIGKTVFIHPHSRGSSKPGWTVTTWAKKFMDRLPPGSYDSFVCGHTHQVYKGIIGSNMLIEQGCLCDFMSYSWQPNQTFSSSAMSGYAVIYQDADGNTDFNESKFVYLGQLLPINKPVFGGR